MKAALLLAALPLAAWAALRAMEGFLLFHPSRAMSSHPGTVGLRWEPIALKTADGVALKAWWIPGPAEESKAMLCLHGNAGNLSHRTDKMRIFHDAGAAQLWVEWRGYGQSAGRPSEKGLIRDADAGLVWLMTRVPAGGIVVYGESMGSGPAVELAARGGLGGLILDGAFSSIRDMARVVVPWLPAFVIATRFDNLSKLPQVPMPVLVLHSPQDEIVPFAQARRNFEALQSPKRFVELKGGHDDGFLDSGRAYSDAIRDFLAAPPAAAPAKKG